MATVQRIFAGTADNPSPTTTQYYNIFGGGTLWSAAECDVAGIVSTPGTFKNLKVILGAEPGSGNSYAFTIRKNGAATNLSVTISGTDTESTTDTDEVSFAAGDLISIESVPTSSPDACLRLYWTLDFVPTTSGETIFNSSSDGANVVTERYVPLISCSPSDATEFYNTMYCPTAGTFKNFYIKINAAPGASKTRTYTVYKNGSPTTITITIANSETSGSDTAHSFTVAAGDRVTVYHTIASTAATAICQNYGICFVPSNAGEFFTATSSDDVTSKLTTEYCPLICSETTYDIEAEQRCLAMSATAKKMYVNLSADPGTNPDAYTFTLRNTSGDTSLAVTIVADNTSGSDTHDVTINDNDLLSLSIAPISSPATAVSFQSAILFYIAPTGGGGVTIPVFVHHYTQQGVM